MSFSLSALVHRKVEGDASDESFFSTLVHVLLVNTQKRARAKKIAGEKRGCGKEFANEV